MYVPEQKQENPLFLLGQYSDDEVEDKSGNENHIFEEISSVAVGPSVIYHFFSRNILFLTILYCLFLISVVLILFSVQCSNALNTVNMHCDRRLMST